MDAWTARLEEARQAILDDDEDDEANMGMTFDQLQDIMDAPLPRRGVAGGSCEGKRANIERARVLMDERMHLDYFAEAPVWVSSFFHRHYRMRRSLFLTIMDRVCARDNYFFAKTGCLWLGGTIRSSKNHCCLANVCIGCVHRRHG